MSNQDSSMNHDDSGVCVSAVFDGDSMTIRCGFVRVCACLRLHDVIVGSGEHEQHKLRPQTHDMTSWKPQQTERSNQGSPSYVCVCVCLVLHSN